MSQTPSNGGISAEVDSGDIVQDTPAEVDAASAENSAASVTNDPGLPEDSEARKLAAAINHARGLKRVVDMLDEGVIFKSEFDALNAFLDPKTTPNAEALKVLNVKIVNKIRYLFSLLTGQIAIIKSRLNEVSTLNGQNIYELKEFFAAYIEMAKNKTIINNKSPELCAASINDANNIYNELVNITSYLSDIEAASQEGRSVATRNKLVEYLIVQLDAMYNRFYKDDSVLYDNFQRLIKFLFRPADENRDAVQVDRDAVQVECDKAKKISDESHKIVLLLQYGIKEVKDAAAALSKSSDEAPRDASMNAMADELDAAGADEASAAADSEGALPDASEDAYESATTSPVTTPPPLPSSNKDEPEAKDEEKIYPYADVQRSLSASQKAHERVSQLVKDKYSPAYDLALASKAFEATFTQNFAASFHLVAEALDEIGVRWKKLNGLFVPDQNSADLAHSIANLDQAIANLDQAVENLDPKAEQLEAQCAQIVDFVFNLTARLESARSNLSNQSIISYQREYKRAVEIIEEVVEKYESVIPQVLLENIINAKFNYESCEKTSEQIINDLADLIYKFRNSSSINSNNVNVITNNVLDAVSILGTTDEYLAKNVKNEEELKSSVDKVKEILNDIQAAGGPIRYRISKLVGSISDRTKYALMTGAMALVGGTYIAVNDCGDGNDAPEKPVAAAVARDAGGVVPSIQPISEPDAGEVVAGQEILQYQKPVVKMRIENIGDNGRQKMVFVNWEKAPHSDCAEVIDVKDAAGLIIGTRYKCKDGSEFEIVMADLRRGGRTLSDGQEVNVTLRRVKQGSGYTPAAAPAPLIDLPDLPDRK